MGKRYYLGLGTQSENFGIGSSGAISNVTAWTAAPVFDWADIRANSLSDGSFLGLATAGPLYGWGQNYNYALGLGDTTPRGTPTQIISGTVTSFAMLADGGLAVKSDGTLWAWGFNSQDELGFGDATSRDTPTQVGALTTWSKVAAGGYFSVAIKTDGTLWSTGLNEGGATGQGTVTGNTTTWTQVGSATDWADIRCGTKNVIALTTGGVLYAWGDSTGFGGGSHVLAPATLGSGTWVGITAGVYTMGAWKSDGSVYVIGANGSGQLGVAGDPISSLTVVPTLVADSVHMATGFNGTVIFTTGGDMYAAGDNLNYYLGLPSAAEYTTFTQVSGVVDGLVFSGALSWSQLLTTETAIAEDITDGFVISGALVGGVSMSQAVTETALGVTTMSVVYQPTTLVTDSADIASSIEGLTYTMYLEAIGLGDTPAASSNTTSSILDSFAAQDVLQQAINQIVADTANGADTFSLGAAITLVDIADAAATHVTTYNSVMLVAELIATLEAYNGADGYDITEASTLSDAYTNRVQAIYAMLETVQAVDTNVALIHVMQAVTDTTAGTDTLSSAGSVINALLSDAVLATIRLNIGGELFTGWVLNTDTMAPSEYQFADLQFNSACKHGNRYLMAADDGIYEFTEDTGVETVMTYIKTGKMDFGSDLKKRVVNSYMVYSASGDMVLKVTTSEYGNLVTRNYRVVAQADDTTDTRRVDIGRGIKSRYWQFELVGDGVDCDIDEVGLLPIVLSRRL